jgi:hypothetical protein
MARCKGIVGVTTLTWSSNVQTFTVTLVTQVLATSQDVQVQTTSVTLWMATETSSLPLTRVDHTFQGPDPTSSHVIPTQPPTNRLTEDEEIWRDRYSFLLNYGLQLRLRYSPGWIPSWIGKNMDPETCEDAIRKKVSLYALSAMFC